MQPLPQFNNSYNGNDMRYVVPNNPEYTRAALALLVKGLQQEYAAVKPMRAAWLQNKAQALVPRTRSPWSLLFGGGRKKPLTARQLAARNSAVLARRRRRAASAAAAAARQKQK